MSTVNNELQDKIAILEGANNDLTNLINTTRIAALFLDTRLSIKRFTPLAKDLFRLISTDVGRPIGDISQRFTDPNLMDDANEVLNSLRTMEKEIETDERRCHEVWDIDEDRCQERPTFKSMQTGQCEAGKVTASIELAKQLTYQATHDPLTSLISRQEFERRIRRVLETARSEPGEHVLCFLDLDQFKLVNDARGHSAGDALLRELSTMMQSQIRHRDTLARLGGDEFGLRMEHCPLDEARHAANSIRRSIENYRFTCEDKVFSVGISIGLVAISDVSMDIDELMLKADAACYAAKDAGRNRVHAYTNGNRVLAERH